MGNGEQGMGKKAGVAVRGGLWQREGYGIVYKPRNRAVL